MQLRLNANSPALTPVATIATPAHITTCATLFVLSVVSHVWRQGLTATMKAELGRTGKQQQAHDAAVAAVRREAARREAELSARLTAAQQQVQSQQQQQQQQKQIQSPLLLASGGRTGRLSSSGGGSGGGGFRSEEERATQRILQNALEQLPPALWEELRVPDVVGAYNGDVVDAAAALLPPALEKILHLTAQVAALREQEQALMTAQADAVRKLGARHAASGAVYTAASSAASSASSAASSAVSVASSAASFLKAYRRGEALPWADTVPSGPPPPHASTSAAPDSTSAAAASTVAASSLDMAPNPVAASPLAAIVLIQSPAAPPDPAPIVTPMEALRPSLQRCRAVLAPLLARLEPHGHLPSEQVRRSLPPRTPPVLTAVRIEQPLSPQPGASNRQPIQPTIHPPMMRPLCAYLPWQEWLQSWDAAYSHFSGDELQAQTIVEAHLRWRR